MVAFLVFFGPPDKSGTFPRSGKGGREAILSLPGGLMLEPPGWVWGVGRGCYDVSRGGGRRYRQGYRGATAASSRFLSGVLIFIY